VAGRGGTMIRSKRDSGDRAECGLKVCSGLF
jgi:hypothetical protein